MGGLRDLGQAYLLTDDPVYAHKCAVMLAKLASEYERFDYAKQCYHEGVFGIGGRISDHIWSCGNNTTVALASDAIWPAFGKDPELLAFLKTKGLDDPRGVIQAKMLNVMADDILKGRVSGNMGMHQQTACHLALVLANDDPAKGHTTQEMRDWLMKGNGRIEDLLWNGFFRDGLGGESSPGYASSWCTNFYAVARLLPRLGVDIWSNPRLKKMADIGLDLTVAGKWSPDIGDSGGIRGSVPIARAPELQGPAFMHYKDPRHAKALKAMGARSQDLFEEYFDEDEVARACAADPTELEWMTRNIGGYGLAALESGRGDSRRAVTLYYGFAGGGHGHHDRLTLQMWSNGLPILPDDGYPFPFRRPEFHAWRSSDTVRHYGVVVDECGQQNLKAGHLNTLAATPELQLMDASAEVAYPGMVSLYRRTSALIDVSPAKSYLLDIFRVRGGGQHDWCFHGPPFPEFTVAGGTLGAVQEKGTLAGENVPYGAKPPPSARGDITLNLLKAEGLIPGTDYGPLSLKGWAVFGDCILTRTPSAAVKIASAPIPAGKVKVFIHIYDYDKGSNTVDLTLGGVTTSLPLQPGGKVGYRWISGIVELPAPAAEVIMTAKAVGQEFIQVNAVLVSRKLEDSEPAVSAGSDSGFHGLYNVRRMTPAGAWSATWRRPEDGLALTMTMPAGCAREVITADASPELQPGNPSVIQYVLGRNRVPDPQADAAAGLLSKYVAVVEPHNGPAELTGVECLQAADATPETVGVAVHRGAVTDFIHSSLNPAETCDWQGAGQAFAVAAEFAMVTVDATGVRRAVVVNGTRLQYGEFSLAPAPSPKGKVLALNFDRNSLTVEAASIAPESCRDSVVILGNALHQTSYTIREAKPTADGLVLDLGDMLYVAGMGAVIATDTAANTVTADRDLSGYGRGDGAHVGRWLYNEDKSKGFRITALHGRSLVLDGASGNLDDIFTDADGDGRRLYWISDIGPGDTYRIPAVTYYARGQ